MNILKPVCKFAKRNGPTILTVVASGGVIATGVLSAKGALKADEIMRNTPPDQLKSGETKKQVVKAYIWPVVSGLGTIGCIVGAHLMNKKIQAGLIAAYTVLDTTYKAYRLNIGLGSDEDNKAMDAVHDVYIQYNAPDVLDECPGEGYILWRDDYHMYPYWATENDIWKATAWINKLILDPNSGRCDANLSDFYAFVKTEHEDQDSLWGWSFDYMSVEWDCGVIETDWREEAPYIDPTGHTYPTRYLRFFCEPLFNYLDYDEEQGAERIQL